LANFVPKLFLIGQYVE